MSKPQTLEQIADEIRALVVQVKKLQDEAHELFERGERLKLSGYVAIAKSLVGQTVMLSDSYCDAHRLTHLKSVSALIQSVGRRNINLDFANGAKYTFPIADVLFCAGLPNDAGARSLDMHDIYKQMFPRKQK